MTPRTLRSSSFSLVAVALLAGCGGKKSPPAGGAGSAGPIDATGPISPAGGDAAAAVAPPPTPLPALAADPGGATGDVTSITPFGGPRTDSTRAIAVTPDGGAVVAGYFEDTAKFGAIEKTGAGKSDAFVAKLGPDGAVAWVTALGSPNEETADALAVGADGTIVVGGLFSDELVAGGLKAKAVASDDLYVAALSPAGEVKWLWTTGAADSDATTALAATPDGGYVAAVSWHDRVKFGEVEVAAKGYDDAALVKLSATGAVQWVTPIAGDGSEAIKRLAVDANGTIFALGAFQQTLDLGAGPLTSAGAMDLLVAAFDATGHHLWSSRAGNPWNEVAGGIALDRAGNVVITGSFDRDADLWGTKLVAAGESDVLVARFSHDGKPQWVKRFGSEREDIGYGVAVDDAGNAVVTGWFETPIDFGGGKLVGKGQKDGFVAKFTPDGAHVWSKRFGDWDNDSGNAVAIAPDNTVWLAGMFRYKLDLTPAGVTSTIVVGDKVQRADGFVAHLQR
ncbi:MAG: hypothetical protein JNK64_01825 [Myxococcales bacterium]|nr:hypothetical protein [Myxococcales bacterium]